MDIDIIPAGNATEYGASGITGYGGNQCVKHDGTVFAGTGDEVKLTFSHNYGDSQVNYSIYKNNGEESVLNADENGIYTVTMSDDFVKLRAQVNAPVVVISEDGTIDKPYLIKDATNWNYFASLVNKGEGSYDEAYYKLDGDINVMTMMGSSDHPSTPPTSSSTARSPASSAMTLPPSASFSTRWLSPRPKATTPPAWTSARQP